MGSGGNNRRRASGVARKELASGFDGGRSQALQLDSGPPGQQEGCRERRHKLYCGKIHVSHVLRALHVFGGVKCVEPLNLWIFRRESC